MGKNYKNIFERTGDSVALNQKFYVIPETTKGVMVGPTDSSFFYTKGGGAVTHTQPKQSSPHRSGRHNTDIYKEKKVTEWNIPTFVNIDTSQLAAGVAEVEDGIQTLWLSLLGKEDTSGTGVVYTSENDPDLTFSLHECGDKWAQQVPAAFVQQGVLSLPGDGQAGIEWTGRGADRFRMGISISSVDNDGGNTFTCDTASHAKRFQVGGLVMIIEGDGETRSADTPNGSYRKVTARDTGTGVVTLDGAPLADADGSGGAGTEVYLVYAEPEAPVGIADIQTGLVGSADIGSLGTLSCMRSASITMNNNHEVVDYCYGTDGLANPYFVPGSRLQVDTELEMNLNDAVIEFLDDLDSFTAQALEFILGDVTGRHLKVEIPKQIFDVPSTSLPEEGSIPVTFSGTGFQTALDAADEITVSYL